MASYRLEFSATAERQLKKLADGDQIRLLRAIQALAEEPRPRGCRKLRGYVNVYRVRVGVYRVLYGVENDRLVVLVLKIGHRKDIYR
jgi:mRNA interferase RelE/StbE